MKLRHYSLLIFFSFLFFFKNHFRWSEKYRVYKKREREREKKNKTFSNNFCFFKCCVNWVVVVKKWPTKAKVLNRLVVVVVEEESNWPPSSWNTKRRRIKRRARKKVAAVERLPYWRRCNDIVNSPVKVSAEVAPEVVQAQHLQPLYSIRPHSNRPIDGRNFRPPNSNNFKILPLVRNFFILFILLKIYSQRCNFILFFLFVFFRWKTTESDDQWPEGIWQFAQVLCCVFSSVIILAYANSSSRSGWDEFYFSDEGKKGKITK